MRLPATSSLGPVRCSDVFRWFLGGWIAHAPEVMVFYAPTVNSYKRFVDASWAPTRLAWSHDNRTAGFRVVGDGESLRIECRIPGADCNPYLAFAAALASGLDGIANADRAAAVLRGRRLRGARSAARALHAAARPSTASPRATSPATAFGDEVVEHYATSTAPSRRRTTRR